MQLLLAADVDETGVGVLAEAWLVGLHSALCLSMRHLNTVEGPEGFRVPCLACRGSVNSHKCLHNAQLILFVKLE